MCTTIIVGKYASKTGRVIVGHNEDAGGRSLHQQFFCPGGKHAPGEVVSGEPGMAKVPQVPETLDVYWSNMLAPAPGSSFDQGFANEAGLVICSNAGGSAFDAESTDLTDGGVAFLLRRLMAERAKTAREAVEVARELLERYGYAGEARNYTVADRDEAWVINAVRGRRFVAKRVPDDCVMLISNALAIRTVDRSDTANVVASADLVEYAVAQGRYTPAHPSSFDDFDFARAYQSDDNRRNPEKSIRLREGWLAITGKYFEDELHYPEAMPPKAPMSSLSSALIQATSSLRYILMSTATWSLRLRAVCSRLPTSPRRLVSSCSTNICMSSAVMSISSLPLWISSFICSSSPTIALPSASLIMPLAASMAACALLPSISWAYMRLSKRIDELKSFTRESVSFPNLPAHILAMISPLLDNKFWHTPRRMPKRNRY